MTQGYDPNDPSGQGGYQPPQYGNQPPQYGSQPPPAPQYGGGPGGYGAPPENDQNALIALIISIASIVFFCPIAAIVSLIMANGSKRRIEESGGRLGGLSQANAARIISFIALGLAVLGIIVSVLFFILAAASGNSSGY
jgi:hypothetical protein